MAMDPNAYLESLGILSAGGYASPDVATPDAALGAGAANGTDPLTQAKVLAQLTPPGANGVQRFGAGLGAKTGKPPGNKWVAAADGAMAGFSGAVGANAAARKAGATDIASRMNLLKTLFGMDRQLANDKSMQQYRQDSLDVARERTRLGGAGHYTDPLVREKNMKELLKPWQDKLDEDDSLGATSPRKLKPEARKAIEDARDAERARLEGMTSVPRGAPAAPAAGQPMTSTPITREQFEHPQPGGPAAQSPTGLQIPIPGAPAPAAPDPAPAPVPTPPPAPARPPAMTKETLIPAALEKLKSGTVSVDQIIAGAKEKFGVDLSPQDLGIAPTPQQPPGPPAPDAMAIENGNVPTPSAPAGFGVSDILRSLFGGS